MRLHAQFRLRFLSSSEGIFTLRPKYAAIVLAIHFSGCLRIAAVPIQSQLVPALLQSTPGRPTLESLYIPPHKPPNFMTQRQLLEASLLLPRAFWG